MDATLVAVIGLALMALLMLLGQPIAFTMLAAGVIGNAYLLTPAAATHLADRAGRRDRCCRDRAGRRHVRRHRSARRHDMETPAVGRCRRRQRIALHRR